MRGRMLGGLVSAVALMIGLAVPAQAQEEGLEATTWRLDEETFENLAAATVVLQPLGSAEETQAGFRFPVIRDTLAENAARVEHRGGVAFQSGAGELKLKHFKFRIDALGAAGTLAAQTPDGRVRLADVKLTHIRDDDAQLIPEKAKMELAGDGARALTDALGLEIEKGLPLGKLRFR
jgi:hypothetical protein